MSRPIAAFVDGVSNTAVAAEVKAYQPILKSCFANGSGGTLAGLNNPNQVPDPLSSPSYIVAAATNGKCKIDTAHVKWSIGSACYDGFTTALPPNTRVLVGNPQEDYDLDSIDENNGGPTYAAVTSRSYHPAGVNVLFGDGSVRFIKSTIAGLTLGVLQGRSREGKWSPPISIGGGHLPRRIPRMAKRVEAAQPGLGRLFGAGGLRESCGAAWPARSSEHSSCCGPIRTRAQSRGRCRRPRDLDPSR